MARKAKIKTTKSGVTDSSSLNKEVRRIIPEELEFAPPVPPAPGVLLFPMVKIELDQNAYKAVMKALEESVEDDLEGMLDKAFAGVARDLKKALDDAMESPVWKWSSGGSRDIVDTGSLKDSGSVIIDRNGVSVSYSSPYAGIVHDGGYIQPYGNPNARPVYYPKRPWIRATLLGGGPTPQFDFSASVMRNL
jgi:hypothetical protein